MVAPQSGGGVPHVKTGAEVAVATLELIDKVKQKKAPEQLLVTLPVGECLRLFNLPATHQFAHLNNTYVFVDRPRSLLAHAAPSRLVPVIEARSGQRFEVPYACIQAVPPSSAPYTLAMTDGMFWHCFWAHDSGQKSHLFCDYIFHFAADALVQPTTSLSSSSSSASRFNSPLESSASSNISCSDAAFAPAPAPASASASASAAGRSAVDVEASSSVSSTAESSDASASTSASVVVEITRSDLAYNEYTQSQLLFSHCVPDLLPLGVGPAPHQQGSMSTASVRHFVLQFFERIARCWMLVFILFNMMQRHIGTSRLTASVKNNVLAFRKFQQLFANEEKVQRLRDAVKHPDTSAAKAATRELDQVVSTFSKLVPFSPASRRARLGDFMAMLRFFGIPRFFNTVAPDPLGNAAAIRNAFPFVDNRSFPALDDGFADRFRGGASTVKHRLPHASPTAAPVETSLNLTLTLSRLVSHPMAVAEADRLDTMATLEHLYGIPATNDVRRTLPVSKRKMGLFGRAFAVAAVTECNGKGWLHNHGLLWSGIPAIVYDLIVHYADQSLELMLALMEFCDAMTRANLPDDLHAQVLLGIIYGCDKYRAPLFAERVLNDSQSLSSARDGAAAAAAATDADAMLQSSSSSSSSLAFPGVHDGAQPLSDAEQHCLLGAARVNIHTHGSRCFQGSCGDIRCSLCYPRTMVQLSRVAQLTEPRRSDDDPLRPVVGEMLEVELARPPIDVDAFLRRLLTLLPPEFASSSSNWADMDVENEEVSAAAASANADSDSAPSLSSSSAEADGSTMNTTSSSSDSADLASSDEILQGLSINARVFGVLICHQFN